jgi:hypothetical protein
MKHIFFSFFNTCLAIFHIFFVLPTKLAQYIRLLTYVRDVHGSNLDTGYPSETFRGFLLPPSNHRHSTQITSWPLPSISFSNHYPPIGFLFHALMRFILSQVLTLSVSKKNTSDTDMNALKYISN